MQAIRKKKTSRVTAVLLALMVAVTFIPTLAFAADSTDGITVYMTVSDEGVFATANDGSPMAWKEVKATDADGDGQVTFYEALLAAHKEYNTEEGLDINTTSGWVNAVWGKSSPAGSSFLKNGRAFSSMVTEEALADGDYLTASLNQDTELYADWASNFDAYEKTVYAGDKFKLNLQGYAAMTINDFAPVPGVKIGTWEKGAFQAVKGVVTDSKGNVTLSFSKPGTYYVTASGTVKDTIDAVAGYNLQETTKDKDGKTIYGKTDWTTYDSFVGYTEKDYGEGPYPWSEIKWIDLEEFEADEFSEGHLLYAGMVTSDCPLIAPCCIVTVKDKTDISKKAAKISKASYVYSGKAIKPAVTIAGLKAGRDFTAAYKNNTAIGKATITITGKNGCKGKITKTFKIIPAKAAIAKAKKGKKKITVNIKAQKGGVKYQVAYKLKTAKKWKYKKVASKKVVLKGLKAKKKYSVKVRAYKGAYYGAWSVVKTVKTK